MTDITESAAWQRGAARAVAEAAAAADQQPDETPVAASVKPVEPLPPVDLTLDPAKHWTNWPTPEETSS